MSLMALFTVTIINIHVRFVVNLLYFVMEIAKNHIFGTSKVQKLQRNVNSILGVIQSFQKKKSKKEFQVFLSTLSKLAIIFTYVLVFGR